MTGPNDRVFESRAPRGGELARSLGSAMADAGSGALARNARALDRTANTPNPDGETVAQGASPTRDRRPLILRPRPKDGWIVQSDAALTRLLIKVMA